jgi:uncharacterized protein YqiB (DUF1249 family)
MIYSHCRLIFGSLAYRVKKGPEASSAPPPQVTMAVYSDGRTVEGLSKTGGSMNPANATELNRSREHFNAKSRLVAFLKEYL